MSTNSSVVAELAAKLTPEEALRVLLGAVDQRLHQKASAVKDLRLAADVARAVLERKDRKP
jgi:hypothetical protein